jgi:hypothetical protein
VSGYRFDKIAADREKLDQRQILLEDSVENERLLANVLRESKRVPFKSKNQ